MHDKLCKSGHVTPVPAQTSRISAGRASFEREDEEKEEEEEEEKISRSSSQLDLMECLLKKLREKEKKEESKKKIKKSGSRPTLGKTSSERALQQQDPDVEGRGLASTVTQLVKQMSSLQSQTAVQQTQITGLQNQNSLMTSLIDKQEKAMTSLRDKHDKEMTSL
jgi:hypothetical protein